MESKGTSIVQTPHLSIGQDGEFYKYIFKKTEKISCAVFYIIRHAGLNKEKDSVVDDLETASKTLSDTALRSLKATPAHLGVYAEEIQYALIALETKLRIAHAALFLSSAYLDVFLHEIDTVNRTLKRYIEEHTQAPFAHDVPTMSTEVQSAPRIQRTEYRPKKSEESARLLGSRRDRILAVIKDKGEAMIKDISVTVTDCSEKTIQRELISLIKDNVIVRYGERRWSKYKLAIE